VKREKLNRKEVLKQMERKAQIAQGVEFDEKTERENAVLVIQKYYRGYKGREKVDQLRQEEFEFLGMKKVETEKDKEEGKSYENMRMKRIIMQKEN